MTHVKTPNIERRVKKLKNAVKIKGSELVFNSNY